VSELSFTFGGESFQAITCMGIDNSEQTRENTHRTTQNKQSGPK